MTRQLNYYGHTNSFHTYKERISVLKALRASLENLLASGFNPYSVKNNDIDSKSNAFDAIDYAMGIKKNHMKHSSFVRFTSDINKFKDYLKANGYDVRFISSINKKTVTNYLNGVIPEVSTRSRNNYKTNIGSLWQILEDEGVIERNFIKSISMLKSKPNRNKTYTDAQVEELFRYMETNTPQLLLFVKFVSYGFLRPLEVCRLTHNSFNWKDYLQKMGIGGNGIFPKMQNVDILAVNLERLKMFSVLVRTSVFIVFVTPLFLNYTVPYAPKV
mgnify:CR=1 FL=1